MSIVAKITVYGDVETVVLSNVRDDGAFLNEELVSVNGVVVNRTELRNALEAVSTALQGVSNGW